MRGMSTAEAGQRDTADVVIVGAGAAGLATAVFCARAARGKRVVCTDGAKAVGAKILVSGGGRCNVTNRVVTEQDFWGSDPRIIRKVLRAYPAARAIAFFEELGVGLNEEADGKYFPTSNRARTVLDALIRALHEAAGALHVSRRVVTVERSGGGFALSCADGHRYEASTVVLATGGRSLPKTGSDGAGYAFARAFDHGYVETTPALVPLITSDRMHAALSGVSHRAAVSVRVDGAASIRVEGALLWTHFGVSGPVILDASRHWLRARLDGRDTRVVLHVLPDATFETLEAWLLAEQRNRPRALVRTVLASELPASVADAWVGTCGIDPSTTMSHLSRDERRLLIAALLDTDLDVRDSRGYNHAEVTAGGIPLSEVDPATMESRFCRRLFLVGEMLDVDGRIGGFNFQWAWSSAWVAAQAIARTLQA